MRIVFVNHLHPACGLVGGLRLWRFAEELAKRGHRIVFITESVGGADVLQAADLPQLFDSHDWRLPLLVPCRASSKRAAARPGQGKAARVLGKIATALTILFRGGVFWRWRREAQQYFKAIAAGFRPELTYATFGNLDALNIARALARQCRIPWIMDVKDPITQFVPRAFWPLFRFRYADAAATTFNAEFQRQANSAVLRGAALVVYSGADLPEAGGLRDADAVTSPGFNLIGSIYSDEEAYAFLGAYATFAAGCRRTGAAPVLTYYGVDHARVAELVRRLGSPPGIAVEPQIPRMELLQRCKAAWANCYLASPRTYHHKLFELLMAGRPTIAYPFERAESIDMAAQVDCRLFVCRTEDELIDAWSSALAAPSTAPEATLEKLGWPRFSRELEALFVRVTAAAR
jgi:hypothetical protein